MKVFISQPMGGLTKEEIQSVRKQAEKDCLRMLENINGKVEFLDSYFEDDDIPEVAKNSSLYYLGLSLELLAEADYAYFCKGWNFARGCAIERHCALAYGVPVLEEGGAVVNEH